MNKKRIFIIRHGQTTFNVVGRVLGTSDPDLTDTGINQVHDLALRLKQKAVNAQLIYTSPLKRAIQTARIIQRILGGNIKKTKLLREIDYGVYDGMPNTILKEIDYGYNTQMILKGNAETVAQVEKRVKVFLNKLFKSKEENILIITHAFTASILAQVLMNVPRTFKHIQPLSTANYNYFEVEGGGENTSEK